jgi:transposase
MPYQPGPPMSQASGAGRLLEPGRLRWDTRTRDYLTRRITEGKTRREAIRCLKRYIAREIYQIITSPPETQPSTP